MINEVLDVVICAVAVAFLIRLAFFDWPETAVDEARQVIFEHRNELFRLAAAGKISFDDPIYIEVRQTLNGMIRFTHRIFFLHMIAWIVLVKRRDFDDGAEDLSAQIEAIHDAEIRKAFKRSMEGATRALLILMANRSLIFWCIRRIFRLLHVSMPRDINRQVRVTIQREAMSEGLQSARAGHAYAIAR